MNMGVSKIIKQTENINIRYKGIMDTLGLLPAYYPLYFLLLSINDILFCLGSQT